MSRVWIALTFTVDAPEGFDGNDTVSLVQETLDGMNITDNVSIVPQSVAIDDWDVE